MDDQTYWAWAAIVGAGALHWAYWTLAPSTFELALKGELHERAGVSLRWPMLLGAISFFAWPVFAITRLTYPSDPSLISSMLYVIGAVGLAWMLSRLVLGLFDVFFVSRPMQLSLRDQDVFNRRLVNAIAGLGAVGLLVTAVAWSLVYYDVRNGYVF